MLVHVSRVRSDRLEPVGLVQQALHHAAAGHCRGLLHHCEAATTATTTTYESWVHTDTREEVGQGAFSHHQNHHQHAQLLIADLPYPCEAVMPSQQLAPPQPPHKNHGQTQTAGRGRSGGKQPPTITHKSRQHTNRGHTRIKECRYVSAKIMDTHTKECRYKFLYVPGVYFGFCPEADGSPKASINQATPVGAVKKRQSV